MKYDLNDNEGTLRILFFENVYFLLYLPMLSNEGNTFYLPSTSTILIEEVRDFTCARVT